MAARANTISDEWGGYEKAKVVEFAAMTFIVAFEALILLWFSQRFNLFPLDLLRELRMKKDK